MSLSIGDAPNNLNYSEEFNVSVNLNGAPKNTTYYLQVAFTAPENPAYFGYTQKNDGSWYKYGETYDNFYQITIDEEGSWSGKIKGKPDSEDKDFKGSGNYILKVGRFTTSGKSHDWSDNSLTLNIQAPPPSSTPIPTVTPTSKPTPTPKPTNTPFPSVTPKPQNTPTTTIKITPTLTKIPSITISPKPVVTLGAITPKETQEEAVLGESVKVTESGEKTEIPKTAKRSSLLLLILLIGGGVGCIGAAVVLSYKKIRKQNSYLS